jgi:hypothetical protein
LALADVDGDGTPEILAASAEVLVPAGTFRILDLWVG